ncbi:Transposase [Oopsacas minuta]|uniref:Transposase n=1 Tax=Oopsacas minuta TaxID=111878 RepID=A0AAV7JRQ7_9METZ|nr:Transposase [Oopsacas minuta]
MARELSVNHETMRKLVFEDLGLKSFKRKKVHYLNSSIRTKRLARSKALLQRLAPGTQNQILFSDEKIFTFEEAWNRQNDRIFATSPTAIPENQKYIDSVQKSIVAGQNLFRNNTWIFQQDSAHAHASKSTQDWLRARKIEFINKDEWLPSSPDLNSLDYSVWANLVAKACAKPHKSLDSLQLSLQREWQKIPQDELRNGVGNFRTRLQAVISQKGGYIE